MTKEQMIEEMKKRGYDVIEDNHVTTFKREGFIEDLIPEIRKDIEEIGYRGTWGVKAISKHPAKRSERVLSEEPAAAYKDEPDDDPYNDTDDTPTEEPVADIPDAPDPPIKRAENPINPPAENTADNTEGLKPEGERVEKKKTIKKESTVTEFKQLSLMDMFG